MAIYKPDEYRHNNSDMAFVEDDQFRGGAVSVETKQKRNEIPLDKRKVYMIVSYLDGSTYETMKYINHNLDDGSWIDDSNWVRIAGGGGDDDYFTKNEHIDATSGIPDAGKPIVLNTEGVLDKSMYDSSSLEPILITWEELIELHANLGVQVGQIFKVDDKNDQIITIEYESKDDVGMHTELWYSTVGVGGAHTLHILPRSLPLNRNKNFKTSLFNRRLKSRNNH